MGAFGEKLRKQREQRGIELDAISNTTKISTRMLRALEEEHFDQLPGGVFNKGFVRAYARHVGLDEQEAIADYLAALNGSQVPPQENLPTPRTIAPNRAESAVATAKIPAQVRP
ncbi:MAG: helix-turn-helix transcriptional regulator, partial [Candidatus Sulfotelmatobacter sp.]